MVSRPLVAFLHQYEQNLCQSRSMLAGLDRGDNGKPAQMIPHKRRAKRPKIFGCC